MGAIFIDQGDKRALASAIGLAQPGGQFETASATSYDNNFVLCIHLYARVQVNQVGAGNQAP
jgi:hypothetical protein